MDRLTGPVQIVNSDPAPIDAGKLPVRQARADLVLTREGFSASGLAVELGAAARTACSASWAGTAGWQTQLRLDGVDPAALHRRARPLLLDGTIRAQQDGAVTLAHGDLASRGPAKVSAVLDLRMTAERLDVERAILTLGCRPRPSVGHLELKGEQRLIAKGTMTDLNPGLLVKGIQARVSGAFSAERSSCCRARWQVRSTGGDSVAMAALGGGGVKCSSMPTSNWRRGCPAGSPFARSVRKAAWVPPGAGSRSPWTCRHSMNCCRRSEVG